MAGAPHDAEARRAALKLTAAGMSARDAAARLATSGTSVSWRTVARWEASRRAAAASRPARSPKSSKTAEASTAPKSIDEDPLLGEAAAVDHAAFEAELAAAMAGSSDPTELDVAELAALTRLLTRHLARAALGVLPWKDAKPLWEFRALLSKTLVLARPPERVDPAADPTNLSALADLRARLRDLREPADVAEPSVEAVRAHVAQLERHLEAARANLLELERRASPPAEASHAAA